MHLLIDVFFSSILKNQNYGLFFEKMFCRKTTHCFARKTTEYLKYHYFCCHNAKNLNPQEGEKGEKKKGSSH
jgi:hypothetical protein